MADLLLLCVCVCVCVLPWFVGCCRGSFATVKRATSLADGKEWAVKIIDKTKLDADDEAALKVEVEILQTVRC